ncbi:plexin-B-like [Saccoglossus kowalevskii]
MGEDLNLAVDESDVRVMIGSEFCEVISLAWNQLTCVPPAHPPNGGNDKSGAELWVTIGNSLEFFIGSVSYAEEDPPIASWLIAIFTCTLILLLLLSLTALATCIIRRHFKQRGCNIQSDIAMTTVSGDVSSGYAHL